MRILRWFFQTTHWLFHEILRLFFKIKFHWIQLSDCHFHDIKTCKWIVNFNSFSFRYGFSIKWTLFTSCVVDYWINIFRYFLNFVETLNESFLLYTTPPLSHFWRWFCFFFLRFEHSNDHVICFFSHNTHFIKCWLKLVSHSFDLCSSTQYSHIIFFQHILLMCSDR